MVWGWMFGKGRPRKYLMSWYLPFLDILFVELPVLVERYVLILDYIQNASCVTSFLVSFCLFVYHFSFLPHTSSIIFIMPVAPKSPTTQARRTGAPKAKGAVRAKSGCYTCRIRRKVSIPRSPLLCHQTLITFPRNATSSQTQTVVARLVFVYDYNVLVLVQSVQNGCVYVILFYFISLLLSHFYYSRQATRSLTYEKKLKTFLPHKE